MGCLNLTQCTNFRFAVNFAASEHSSSRRRNTDTEAFTAKTSYVRTLTHVILQDTGLPAYVLPGSRLVKRKLQLLNLRYLLNSLLTYLLTHSLTPYNTVLLEKQTGSQLVKKFPAFHGTRKFITALTSVRQLSLYWASPIQSISPHPTS